MLLKFTKINKKLNPTIITAYNGDLFDYAYLFFRSLKLNFNVDEFSILNEVSFRAEFKNKNTGDFKKYYKLNDVKRFIRENNLNDWKLVEFVFKPKGQYCIDYLKVFKKLVYEEQPSYKLEYIAHKFLETGNGKVDYGEYSSIYEFFEKDYDKFFEYAIQDPIVILNLENKLKLLETLSFLAYIMGCNIDTAMDTVQPWAIHLRHIALKENIILPNDTRHQLDKTIAGGYVKEPIKGKHRWIISIDFNSLYPSIMDMLNLCVTTYIEYKNLPDELKEIYNLFRDEDEEKLLNDINLQNKIKELTHKYNVTFNGQGFFTRDKRGLIAQVVADIYYGRKDEKNKMLWAKAIMKNKDGIEITVKEIIEKIENNEINWDNTYNFKIVDIENIKLLDEYAQTKEILQLALKILINSLYGALGTPSFVLFNRDIAAGITFVGRFLNKYTMKKIEKYLKNKYNTGEVITADTDSEYIKIDKIVDKIIEKKFGKSFEKFNEDETKKLTDFILKFIDKEIQPLVDESVKEVQDMFNAYHKGFVGAKVEKIMVTGIFVAKKKYAVAKIWEEGAYYAKPELSVTGLDLVRSSTPEFAKKIFKESLKIMLLKDEKTLQNYLKKTKNEFENVIKTPKGIKSVSRVSGVNSINYKQYENGWYRYVYDSNGNIVKKLPAPINSRASILYNKYVIENNLEEKYELIEEGSKVNFVYLKTPNPIRENVIAYNDEDFLKEANLIEYVDKNLQYEKVIEQPLKTISDAINWELKKTSSLNGLF
jgi:DNA polymerase elongation subunit (family B)